jgi:hypothetical protein
VRAAFDKLCAVSALIYCGWVLRGLVTGCGFFGSIGSC